MDNKTGAEHWFFLAFVASLPFQSILQFRIFSVPVQLPDLMFLAAAAAWAAAYIAGRKTLVRSRFYVFLAAYAISVTLSTIFSADSARSSVKLVGKFYLIGIAALTLNSITSINNLKRTIQAWVFGAGVALTLSLAGIALFYAGLTDPSRNLILHPNFGSLPPGNYPRIEGFFFYPAMLCNFLGVTWMFSVLLVSLNWLKVRTFWLLSPVLLIVNAFTLTPGLGGIFLSTAYFFRSKVFDKKRHVFGRVVTAAGVFLAAAVFIAASITLFSYDPNGTRVPLFDEAISPSPRAAAWSTALEAFRQNPILGHGIGLPVARTEYTDPQGGRRLLTDAHNTYISLLGETGLVGFLAFMGLIGFLTLSLISWKPVADSQKTIRLCFLLALCDAFFYQSLTGSYEDARHLWVFFGIIAAVTIRATESRMGDTRVGQAVSLSALRCDRPA
jgi:putative inorganic carbon (hco3(-)) transporter